MNSLSLFLYFADVIGSVADILFLTGLVTTIFMVACWCLRGIIACDVEKSDLPDEHYPQGGRAYRSWMTLKNITTKKSLYFVIFGSFITCALIPSKNTIYMIAASEVSEMAVTSDVGQEILTDIKTAIKNILKGE